MNLRCIPKFSSRLMLGLKRRSGGCRRARKRRLGCARFVCEDSLTLARNEWNRLRDAAHSKDQRSRVEHRFNLIRCTAARVDPPASLAMVVAQPSHEAVEALAPPGCMRPGFSSQLEFRRASAKDR